MSSSSSSTTTSRFSDSKKRKREGGVVESKPFKTLIIKNIPINIEMRDVEVLLKQQVGYGGCRKVRDIFFVDFTDVKCAILAKDALQGYKFHNNHIGLNVGYDKDGNDVWLDKNKKKTRKEALYRYYCSVCGEEVFSTKNPLKELPIRKTDQSSVIHMEKHIVMINLRPGTTKLIKREKGAEKQYCSNCPACDIQIAYRPVEGYSAIKCKFLYIRNEAVNNQKVTLAAREKEKEEREKEKEEKEKREKEKEGKEEQEKEKERKEEQEKEKEGKEEQEKEKEGKEGQEKEKEGKKEQDKIITK